MILYIGSDLRASAACVETAENPTKEFFAVGADARCHSPLPNGDFDEETAAVPPPAEPAASLKFLFEECGYTGTRLASGYKLGGTRFAFVGFAGKPWDRRSACIAAIDARGDSLAAAVRCRELGAPIAWVRAGDLVDWWILHAATPTLYKSTRSEDFAALVRRHKPDLAPEVVNRAVVAGRLPGARQLDFIDAGLMPFLEKEDGEKLGGLVERMTRSVLARLNRSSPGKSLLRGVFIRVFRLLAGKILKDKRVSGFEDLDLRDPAKVLRQVWRHYNTDEAAPVVEARLRDALEPASDALASFGNVAVVSPETLAYVYEHTLVSEDLRAKLGIHATPPYLVDYIVWQLFDWICDIPIAERHIFEPACGHAPFLLSAMRLLRAATNGTSEQRIHTYLKDHLHGIEVDDFAREIARLSLTLADIPEPNGWDLQPGDMYASNVLADGARTCRILLSNPPYEKFKDADKHKYRVAGHPVRHSKAVELLDRTLKHLPPGGVFGVVVPQSILHNDEGKRVRDLLLKEFELRELCLFADKVFEEGDAETAVILGRRRLGTTKRNGYVAFRRVREDSVVRFAENYAADAEQKVPQADLGKDDRRSLRLPDLPEVWSRLSMNPTVGSIADVGQGFSFKTKGLIAKARAAGKRRTDDAVPAFLAGVRELSIWQLPEEIWLSPSRTPVLTWRSGNYTGKPQVLVNYSPVMRGPWRIKALVDPGGHAVTNTYTTVRPRHGGSLVNFLWAILNSPIANAYIYCNALKRHIYDSLIAALPLPQQWQDHVAAIGSAANQYLTAVRDPDHFKLMRPEELAAREALLNLDAVVVRAYGLSLRMERALLDLFQLPADGRIARRRKGVGCRFGDYFPADFDSLVPLHKFISAEYRQSTVDEIAARMKPGESADVLAGLRAASEAFSEER